MISDPVAAGFGVSTGGLGWRFRDSFLVDPKELATRSDFENAVMQAAVE